MTSSEGQPPRHWFIRLRPGAWAGLRADQRALPDDALLRDWGERGHPVIARRRLSADRAGRVAAAIALPAASTVRRVALDLRPEAIAGIEPPPAVAAVRAGVPEPWHATIDALAALGHAVAAEPRVFGSFAWQALTGLPYVTATSDLDLLWPVMPSLDVPALLAGLTVIARDAPGRLDGELVHGATGAGVQWQEWGGAAETVLVKSADAVTLRSRAAFLRDG